MFTRAPDRTVRVNCAVVIAYATRTAVLKVKWKSVFSKFRFTIYPRSHAPQQENSVFKK